MSKYTFKQFQAEYPNDAACLAKLMEVNYGGTEIICPGCGGDRAKFHPMNKRRAFACQECGHHIYPAAGTIFHKSPTPLTKWFFAMYLITSTRHGVAAKELERQLGVTYKCAWRMAHELRKLMASADHGGTLGGLHSSCISRRCSAATAAPALQTARVQRRLRAAGRTRAAAGSAGFTIRHADRSYLPDCPNVASSSLAGSRSPLRAARIMRDAISSRSSSVKNAPSDLQAASNASPMV